MKRVAVELIVNEIFIQRETLAGTKRRTSLPAEQPFEGKQIQMITIFTRLCSARGQLGARTTEVENIVHNLVGRANLTPPCPNGCKAAISDAVSIGLFPGSDSNVFSSFSFPPFPTIRKYSSILSNSQPPNHQRTPPKLTPRTHRYLIRYLSSAARKV